MLPIVVCPLRCLEKGKDVVQDAAILNEACLRVMDEVRKEWTYASTDHLGEDFVGSSKKGDRTPLPNLLSIPPFQKKTNHTC